MVEVGFLLLGIALLAGVGLGGGSGAGDDADGPLEPNLNSEGDNDTFEGSRFSDEFDGGPGVDFIEGRAGNDLLLGGNGADTIDGNADNDTILGGQGPDSLLGGAGDDTLRGEEGQDFIRGGSGDDGIFGGSENDTIEGADGRDTITGGPGDDDVRGGSGFDTIDGDLGEDTLDGDPGNDVIDGRVLVSAPNTSNGVDTDDPDTLIGDAGADTIFLGNGDIAWGENEGALADSASDTFVSGDWITGDAPEILDFDPASDAIELVYFTGSGLPVVTVDTVVAAGDTSFEVRMDGALVVIVRAGMAPGYTLSPGDITLVSDD